MKLVALSVPEDCKVYTPPDLAEAMVRLLGDRPGDEWLEPCVGKGVFLDALRSINVPPGRVTAIELDHHADLAVKCKRYLAGQDFLRWANQSDERFDRIVGNPPYLPLHRMHPSVRQAALAVPRPSCGTVPPRANGWYAFLCATLRLLKPDGAICFILPSAWEYADYAADLREAILTQFAHVEIHRSEASVFQGVLDGCVVVAASGFGSRNRSSSQWSYRTGVELVKGLRRRPRDREGNRDGRNGRKLIIPQEGLISFGEVAEVRIGGVTGDARYFLMTEEERREREIPLAYVRPVLTRARHLGQAYQKREGWQSLRDAGERVWLLWPRSEKGHPRAVADYLALGEALGIPEKQKVKARGLWYRTRLPPRPDGFLSGMTPRGPWLSLIDMRGLTATNTLYTVHFHGRLRRDEKAAWALALLSSCVSAQHEQRGRRYSDGLLKFEPCDVMRLMVPKPIAISPHVSLVYQEAVSALLEGDRKSSQKIADARVSRCRTTNV